MTKERIWRLDEGGDPAPLTEADYADEADLQKLIAEHPEVLAGERMTPDEPRRWLLISREMGIPDSPDSGDRWAVDHLLLDQDACPTLVEVKRGDNPEIRRSVVGQMFDYAAHATRYWSAAGIRETFEKNAGDEAATRIAKLLVSAPDEDAYEAFWERLGTNLRDENIRLLFVADRIPADLAHVVEFLNRHMGPQVEVLAVELKQFRGEGIRTLVPRVIGRSDGRRGSPRRTSRHTIESLLAEFPEGATRDAARELLDRARAAGAVLAFGSSGVSIRVRCPAWQHPLVTVAWLFPPGVTGWMSMRDFTFGAAIFSGYDPAPSPALSDVLLSYAALFEAEPWAHDASATGTVSWRVAPEDAAEHIGTIANRVETVLSELAALQPADE